MVSDPGKRTKRRRVARIPRRFARIGARAIRSFDFGLLEFL